MGAADASGWTYQGLTRRFGDDLAAIERAIAGNLGSDNELLRTMAAHVALSGGKRLRPLLVVLTARLSGYDGEGHVPLGNAVEYLHAATLLHDDVLDQAEVRRGAPSANAVWGNHLAVLGGDFLYTTAFDLLLAGAPREVIRMLCRCSLDMVEGEVLQRRWRNRADIDEATYVAIVARKTASLIAGCCRSGALLARAEAPAVEALGRFGTALGTAFQVIDDTLDYLADPARLGKALGGDLRQGTVTLPLIHLLRREGIPREQERVRDVIGRGEATDAEVAWIAGLLREHRCGESAIARARTFAAEARAALDPLAGTELREALLAAADFVIARDY
ncbi:MAG TPA: polyprenyl synthetase family protein [bacterium]